VGCTLTVFCTALPSYFTIKIHASNALKPLKRVAKVKRVLRTRPQ
jgi:hypothetical protein